jgi:hypothetical protein
MLSGSDLYAAYSRDIPSVSKQLSQPSSVTIDHNIHDTDKRSSSSHVAQVSQVQQVQPETLPVPVPSSMESPLMTPDEKVYLLSAELKRQRDMYQQQQQHQSSQPSYLDRLWGKKRDVMKLVMFTLVFMLALSLHWVAKYYMKDYLESNALTPTKELFFRMLYPCIILFIVWNMRAFNK